MKWFNSLLFASLSLIFNISDSVAADVLSDKKAKAADPVEFKSNLAGGSGDWEDLKTWIPQGIPGNTDYALISTGDKVTINRSTKIKEITIEKNAQLIIDAGKGKQNISLNLGQLAGTGSLICKGNERFNISMDGILPQGKVDAEVTDTMGWRGSGIIIADYTSFHNCDRLLAEKIDIDNCKFFNSSDIRLNNKNFVSFSNNKLYKNGIMVGSKDDSLFAFDNIDIFNASLNDVKMVGKGIAEFKNSKFNIDNSIGNIVSGNHNKISRNYMITGDVKLSLLKNKPSENDNVRLLAGTFIVDENIICRNLSIDFGSKLIIKNGKSLVVNGKCRQEGEVTGNISIKNLLANGQKVEDQQVPIFSIRKTFEMPKVQIAVLDTPKYILDNFLTSFHLSFDILQNLDNLDNGKYALLILGLGEVKANPDEFIKNKEKLLQFVKDGGTILAFQQNSVNWLDSWLPYPIAIFEYSPASVVISSKNHPIFKNVEPADLSDWKKCVAWDSIKATDPNWIVLANDPKKPEYAAVVECKYGKGHIMINNFAFQFDINKLHEALNIKQVKLFSNILSYCLTNASINIPFHTEINYISKEELEARMKRIKCVIEAFRTLLHEMEPRLECISLLMADINKNNTEVKTTENEVSAAQNKLRRLEAAIGKWRKSETVDLEKAKEYIAEINYLNKELQDETLKLRDNAKSLNPEKRQKTIRKKDDWINNTFHIVNTDIKGKPDCGSLVMKYEYFKRLHTTFSWNPTLNSRYYQGYVPHLTSQEYMKELEKDSFDNDIPICFGTHPHTNNDNASRCNDRKRGIVVNTYCWNNPELIKSMKEQIKKSVSLRDNKRVSYVGVSFDEIGFRGGYCDICKKKFREYLKNKYSSQELAELGVDDIENLLPPLPLEKEEKKVLWMEHQEFLGHSFETAVKDLFDYAHSLDSGVFTYINESIALHNTGPLRASLARLAAIPDIFSIDPYRKADLIQAFMLDLIRSNSCGPTLQFTGAYEDPNKDVYERDLFIGLVHSQGMAIFDFSSIWKYNAPDKWNVTIKTFDKAKQVEDYLINTKSPSKIALLYSERSHTLDFSRPLDWGAPKSRYLMLQFGIYTALTQAHIQTDPIFAEGMTAEKLSKYKVLIAADAKALTKEEETIIRDWVNKGGSLISFGSTTLLDKWGRQQNDYAFSDIFGVSYQKTVIGRGISSIKINEKNYSFGNGEKGLKIFSDDAYGHDIVKPLNAQILGSFADTSPAILSNKYGKGEAIFIAASTLGLLQKGKYDHIFDREHFSVYKKFLSELVKGIIEAQGDKLPFEVENVPENVEVTMREQAQKNRHLLHLLNYGHQVPIRGVKVTLNISEQTDKSKLNVFYADSGKKISFSISKDRVAFPVDNFDVHQMIVIEEDIP